MLFVLRCFFWLSIVYASMSWPKGAFDADDLGARLRTQGAVAARAAAAAPAIANAVEACRNHAAACATDASRLTAILTAEPEDRELEPSNLVAHNLRPSPSARTLHRHVRDERLARTP